MRDTQSLGHGCAQILKEPNRPVWAGSQAARWFYNTQLTNKHTNATYSIPRQLWTPTIRSKPTGTGYYCVHTVQTHLPSPPKAL